MFADGGADVPGKTFSGASNWHEFAEGAWVRAGVLELDMAYTRLGPALRGSISREPRLLT